MVGVGLLYRQGNFHQQLDRSGWQHEFWVESDPGRLPAALVTGGDSAPLTVEVSLSGRPVVVQVWRVNVGRVPLYLLDADRPENSRSDRWITARLYIGDRQARIAQYALLGLAGVRALRAMGIEPAVMHLNEGHAALAPLEVAREAVAEGTPVEEAIEAARRRTVFTTHTPVPAGNEAFSPEEVLRLLGDFPKELGLEPGELLDLGRVHSNDEPFGLTVLGLHLARRAGGVSRRHGQVARAMWRNLYPDRDEADVPITHVTNGVHLPTWMAPPMRGLLSRHLGDGWEERAGEAAAWNGVDAIPDRDLWAVRSALRSELVDFVRDRTVADRLGRGEPSAYAEGALDGFDPEALTIGFARRVVAYKRLPLLIQDPERLLQLLDGSRPVQIVVAGKAHPQDEDAKGILQSVFRLDLGRQAAAERMVFLEDYDLALAAKLVSGCDLWVNLPRPPLEASGTSGMKAALNGGINLSVLDGWWEEAYDGSNGWAIRSDPDADPATQDVRDAGSLYDLLQEKVVAQFFDRDGQGIPRAWINKVKASLRSIGPRFCATRMLQDYVGTIYELKR